MADLYQSGKSILREQLILLTKAKLASVRKYYGRTANVLKAN